MMTIFGLFKSSTAAQAAVDALVEAGAEVDEMNVLVQSEAAKAATEFDRGRAGVATTGKVGEVELHGLNRLVAGQQAMLLSGLGDIYAAGELATMIASAAQGSHREDRGLEGALEEFGLSRDAAARHFQAIKDGGWLIIVRTDHDKARRLQSVLREQAHEVATVTG